MPTAVVTLVFILVVTFSVAAERDVGHTLCHIFGSRHSLSLPSTLHGLNEGQLDATAVVGVVALDALPPFVLRRNRGRAKRNRQKKQNVSSQLVRAEPV